MLRNDEKISIVSTVYTPYLVIACMIEPLLYFIAIVCFPISYV